MNQGKSIIFYSPQTAITLEPLMEIFTKSFFIYKREPVDPLLYICNDHYMHTFLFMKRNSNSTHHFLLHNEPFVENVLNLRVKIDFTSLRFYFNTKLKQLNIKMEDLKFLYQNNNINLIQSIKEGDSESVKMYAKRASMLSDLLRINQLLILECKDWIYFPTFLCFRGRVYFGSSLSFTSFKEIRHALIGDTWKTDFLLLKYQKQIQIVEECLRPYTKRIKKLKKIKFKSNLSPELKYAILWVLISIGEVFKTDLAHNKGKVHIKQFIDCGIAVVNEEWTYSHCDDYDKQKIFKALLILNEYSVGIFRKHLISKDSTASCFQHLVKILGPQDNSSWEKCNLQSKDTWYDTYVFIFQKWLETEVWNEAENKLIKEFWKRKTYKRPIMTRQYGAKELTGWKYFLEEIDSNLYNSLPKNEKNNLRGLFKSFFYFISSSTGLLLNNTSRLVEFLKLKNFHIRTLDGETNISYYKTKMRQINLFINKKRQTKKERILTQTLDNMKTVMATPANFTQCSDATLARKVVEEAPIPIIHDCFLIDPFDTNLLIALINETFNKDFFSLGIHDRDPDNLFSIFVVI